MSKTDLNTLALAAIERKEYELVNRLLLVSSYLYYIRDYSVVDDTTYDGLCKCLLNDWEKAEPAIKKFHTVIPYGVDWLEAGTLFMLREKDYPTIARYAALGILERDNA